MSKTLRELTLATATVTGDLYHVSGADLLDKRITVDDINTACRGLGGGLLATANITQTAGVINARVGVDSLHTFGHAVLGGSGGSLILVNENLDSDATNRAVGQNTNGKTILNASDGQILSHRINNVEKMAMSDTVLTLHISLELGENNITSTADATTQLSNIAELGLGGKGGDAIVYNHSASFGDAEQQLRFFADGSVRMNTLTSKPFTIREGSVEVVTFAATEVEFLRNIKITQVSDTIGDAFIISNLAGTKFFNQWIDATGAARLDAGNTGGNHIIINGSGGAGDITLGGDTTLTGALRLIDSSVTIEKTVVAWVSADTEAAVYTKLETALNSSIPNTGDQLTVLGQHGVSNICYIKRFDGVTLAIHTNLGGTIVLINDASATAMGSDGFVEISSVV